MRVGVDGKGGMRKAARSLAALAVTAALVLLEMTPAQADDSGRDWASVGMQSGAVKSVVAAERRDWQATFLDSGWAGCPEPILWTLAADRLEPWARGLVVETLSDAFGTWSVASGLDFAYSPSPPAAGTVAPRVIAVTLVDLGVDLEAGRTTVGEASPSLIYVGDREIVASEVHLDRGFIQGNIIDHQEVVSGLLLHEIGHALGLPHAGDEASIMFPYLLGQDGIDEETAAQVVALTKPCRARG